MEVVFPYVVDAELRQPGKLGRIGGPKTYIYLKIAPKPENRDYYHFTPFSEPDSALPADTEIKLHN